nr:transmembrane emp24 domain-containing protein p24delta9-like [Tanacetum cinerariifolium]
MADNNFEDEDCDILGLHRKLVLNHDFFWESMQPGGDKKEFGTYAFTANEDGNYMACLMVSKQNPPAILTVEFDWRSGLATKDWARLWDAKHQELFTISYPYVQKVADSYGLLMNELLKVSPNFPSFGGGEAASSATVEEASQQPPSSAPKITSDNPLGTTT